jgi:hypothetical protein
MPQAEGKHLRRPADSEKHQFIAEMIDKGVSAVGHATASALSPLYAAENKQERLTHLVSMETCFQFLQPFLSQVIRCDD